MCCLCYRVLRSVPVPVYMLLRMRLLYGVVFFFCVYTLDLYQRRNYLPYPPPTHTHIYDKHTGCRHGVYTHIHIYIHKYINESGSKCARRVGKHVGIFFFIVMALWYLSSDGRHAILYTDRDGTVRVRYHAFIICHRFPNTVILNIFARLSCFTRFPIGEVDRVSDF